MQLQNKYECTMDQGLVHAAADVPGDAVCALTRWQYFLHEIMS